MDVQLSLSLHLYVLYLLLISSCDGNDAFWHSFACETSSSFSVNTGLSLQICVRQTVRLTTEFVDWCRNVCSLYCTITCPRYKPLRPATWSSASLTHGQAYHKTSSTKQFVNGESDYVQSWGKRTSLWTSASLKPALFRANTRHNRLFPESSTVLRKTRGFASFPPQLFKNK